MLPLHPLFAAFFVLRHLLAVSLLAGAALGCGGRVTARMRWRDGRERWLASIVAGLGMLATLFLALGALGLLYPAIAWLVLVPLFALGMRGRVKGALAQIANRFRHEYTDRHRVRVFIRLGQLAVALAPIIILAFYPPTAFDATLYHLPYTRSFVDSGRLIFASNLRYPVFPQLDEMLFTVMLLVSDDISAQLVQTLATLLIAVILLAWGRRTEILAVGWLAAGLWLGSPIVVYFSASACVRMRPRAVHDRRAVGLRTMAGKR